MAELNYTNADVFLKFALSHGTAQKIVCLFFSPPKKWLIFFFLILTFARLPSPVLPPELQASVQKECRGDSDPSGETVEFADKKTRKIRFK